MDSEYLFVRIIHKVIGLLNFYRILDFISYIFTVLAVNFIILIDYDDVFIPFL